MEIFCPKCGTGQTIASECSECGVLIYRMFEKPGEVVEETDEDRLEPYWYLIIWSSLIIPCMGSWAIVILSSIMYYVWRKEYPVKAKTINMHGWAAFILGNIAGCLIQFAFN